MGDDLVRRIRDISRALALGVAAGMVVLLVDEVMNLLMIGYWTPLSAAYLLAYAAVGAVVSCAVTLLAPRAPGLLVFASVVAVLYAPAIFERTFNALDYRSPMAVAGAVGALAVAAYGLWALICVRLAGPAHVGLGLAALTAAVGLAVNRNLVDYPGEPRALLLDASVLLFFGSLALIMSGSKRRAVPVLAILGCVAAATLMMAVGWDRPSARQSAHGGEGGPNLLLIIVDTLRQDVFRAVVEETEEGRRLATSLEGAAWFSNAVAASPWTAPSVGSIMTGLYPDEHGFGRRVDDPSRPLQRLAASVPTLAEMLESRGYMTVSIGTNTLLHSASGIDRGFSHYEILQPNRERLPLVHVLGRLGLLHPELYQPASEVRRRLDDVAGDLGAEQRPFFLWLHLMDPHYPLRPHSGLAADPAAGSLAGDDLLYRDEVRYVALELARMIEDLRERVDWHNTVTVLVGDHGEMFPSDGHDPGVRGGRGRPMLRGHGHALYEELVHVPLVIRPVGGIPGGRRLDLLTSHVDLLATIADLLGWSPPMGDADQVSVASALRGDQSGLGIDEREAAFIGAIARGPVQYALRTRDLKLIHYPKGVRPTEAYDLQNDPQEQVRIGGDGDGRVADALARLEEHVSAMRRGLTTAPVDFDAQTKERLEALGYVD